MRSLIGRGLHYILLCEVIIILKHSFSKIMDTERFLDVFEEEKNKMKESAVALIIT